MKTNRNKLPGSDEKPSKLYQELSSLSLPVTTSVMKEAYQTSMLKAFKKPLMSWQELLPSITPKASSSKHGGQLLDSHSDSPSDNSLPMEQITAPVPSSSILQTYYSPYYFRAYHYQLDEGTWFQGKGHPYALEVQDVCTHCQNYKEWLCRILANPSTFKTLPNEWMSFYGRKDNKQQDPWGQLIPEIIVPRTQKAAGLLELQKLYASPRFFVPEFHIAQDPDSLQVICKDMKFPRFARACPPRPVHGFIDSKPVNNHYEALAILQAAQTVDPDSELILMPVVNAHHSAIWTNGLLTIGTGNDGATSGKDSFVFKTINQVPLGFSKQQHVQFNSIKDSPFFEFVYGVAATTQAWEFPDSMAWVVQLRDGPSIPAQPDFIPEPLVVQHIWKAEGDLMDWMNKCLGPKPPGLVVWHPTGNLSDHYGVHCVINNIPCITSFMPIVGNLAEQTCEQPGPLHKQAFLRGIQLSLFMPIQETSNGFDNTKIWRIDTAVKFMLAMLHNYPAQDPSNPISARMLGMAVGIMIRLGFTACLGEARHANRRKGGRKRSRNAIYELCLADFRYAKSRVRTAWFKFLANQWERSFGGDAWAGCTEAIVDLWNTLCDYNKGKTGFNVLLAKWNNAINMAHNGGWWFNKFIEQATFDNAVGNPAWIACQAAPQIYEAILLDDPQLVPARLRKIRPVHYEITAQVRPYFQNNKAITFHVQVQKRTGTRAKDRTYYSYNIKASQVDDVKGITAAILFPTDGLHESWSKSGELYARLEFSRRTKGLLIFNKYYDSLITLGTLQNKGSLGMPDIDDDDDYNEDDE